MDPMDRVLLERQVDKLLDIKNRDVHSMALMAKDELKAKRWASATKLVRQAAEHWEGVKPMKVMELLVQHGKAKSFAEARRHIARGDVKVDDAILRHHDASVSPGQSVSFREEVL